MKFASQQVALRTALETVMGETPVKGSLVITDDQRAAVGQLMLGWLKEERWSIKEGTRAHANPLEYITGKRPTDLIQAWTKPRKPKDESAAASAPAPDKMSQIKSALDAGLITQEQAQAAAMKILGI